MPHGVAGLLALHDSPDTLRVVFALADAGTLVLLGLWFPRGHAWRFGFLVFYAFNPFVLLSFTAFAEDKTLLFLGIVVWIGALERDRQGLAWGAAILSMAPRYIWWMMPILAGLILPVPLTMLTSRASVGRWMRRKGLLLTPEETDTPTELVALEEKLASGLTVHPTGNNLDLTLPAPKMLAPTPAATCAT